MAHQKRGSAVGRPPLIFLELIFMNPQRARAAYLRERFSTHGADSFMPRDAIELVLGYCMCDADAAKAVDGLFERFGTAGHILDAGFSELSDVGGMTQKAALMLAVMKDFFTVCRDLSITGEKVADSGVAIEMLKKIFVGVSVEKFVIMPLDKNFRALGAETVAQGTPFTLGLDIGAAVSAVKYYNSDRCVIAHNHPGGSSMPSEADIASTYKMARVMAENGIILLDHIIVGRDGASSVYRTVGAD